MRMKYRNQREYPHILYNCNTDNADDDRLHRSSLDMTGCGLCCAVMAIDRLLVDPVFDLEEALQASYKSGANHEPGTDYHILAPYLAEQFHLKLMMTSDLEELRRCLQTGGCAVANCGGDREGYTGVFSHGGHYICVIAAGADGSFSILDPSQTSVKYDEPGRSGKVEVTGNICKCSGEVLAKDCENRTPSFYCFSRE